MPTSVTPVVFPAADPVAAAPPAPPGSNETVGASESWKSSPGGWFTSLTADTAPYAPELVGAAIGCSAQLTIHDLSDNEEGFAVFRLTPTAADWQLIATLNSQTADDWITYTDSGVPGGLTYSVIAFNGAGQTASDLLLVNIDPADCSQPARNLPVLVIDILQIITATSADSIYCYESLDGETWSRMPQNGFFEKDEDGFDIQGASQQLLLSDLAGQTLIQSVDLALECWGWGAGELQLLGEVMFEGLNLNDLGSRTVGDDQLSVELLVDMPNLNEQPVLFPMEGDFDGFGGNDDDPFSTSSGNLSEGFVPAPLISPEMPLIGAMITYDPDVCVDHLNPDVQNLGGQIIFCFPYKGFDSGPDGANPQPYLVWYFLIDRCNTVISPCKKPYESWLADANVTIGGQVGFNINDHSSAGFHKWTVTGDHFTQFVIPPNGCVGQRTFSVQMWFQGSTRIIAPVNQKPVYGPTSNQVSIACPKLLDSVKLEVTFQTLKLDNVDDGESEPQDVELFGWFGVSEPGFIPGTYVHMGVDMELLSEYEPSNCPDDIDFFGIPGLDQPGCPPQLRNGTYDLSNFHLCVSDDGIQCGWPAFVEKTGHAYVWNTNNNTAPIEVVEGTSLVILVVLYDFDEISDSDHVCLATHLIPSRSLLDWAKVKGETFTMADYLHDAWCEVYGVINAVK